jgi:O-methyltransferase
VPWKERVNAGLALTGHRIVKVKPPAPPAPAPKKKGGRRPIPRDYDDAAKQIIKAVRPRTMTAHEKIMALILSCRYVVDHSIPGAIVECGVWRGGSMQAAALALKDRGVTDRELHLFDTFEGMPPPTDKDVTTSGGVAAELLAQRDKTANVWAVADLEDVQAGMAETGYPAERTHFHVGRTEETIPGLAPEEIAILRLDTDWYESTRHELAHLYDRVPSGGVVLIDDYGSWQGARLAVDEFLEQTGARLLLLPISEGRIAVKP